MTRDEITMAAALSGVSFPAGTWQKRFGRSMAAMAENTPDVALSEKQAQWLRWVVYRFRRQLPSSVVALSLVDGHPPQAPGEEERTAARQRAKLAEYEASLPQNQGGPQ